MPSGQMDPVCAHWLGIDSRPTHVQLPAHTLPVRHYDQPLTALLLSGGGARAAYQVGVLEALSDLRRACHAHHGGNPFGILAGTSAGSINAAALACGADHFDLAVHRLTHHWSSLTVDGVYHADHPNLLRTGLRWMGLLALGWALPSRRRLRPRSLLDNAPLRQRLQDLLPMHRITHLLDQGHLHALAVTASSYTTGQHVTFFDTRAALEPWSRSQRSARRTTIGHEHLLASSAIPFVFPATALPPDNPQEYFGDGAMRQTAPLSPVIHLGANRVLVIGVGRTQPQAGPSEAALPAYPSLAHVAGHALSSIFLDTLPLDIERAQRINQTVALVPASERARTGLRRLEILQINPSDRLDSLAAQHVRDLPQGMRNLLRVLGVDSQRPDTQGAALASYLMFTPSYIQALMALGRSDTVARRDDVVRFFGWHDQGSPIHTHHRRQAA